MSSTGRTIRSAKMKASTPPKLMPPFQSTAASGTLPMEQTKDRMATTGPMSGPQSLAHAPWCSRNALPQGVRHPRGDGAGDEEPEHDVDQDGRSVHDEVLGDRGVAGGGSSRPRTPPFSCTDMSISAWP